MALIHVEDGRLDAQSAQQPYAADAQQDFLHDARRAVTAVHAQGQIAKFVSSK